MNRLAVAFLVLCPYPAALVRGQQFRAEAPPTLAPQVPTTGLFSSSANGDFDGDGDLDLALAGLFALRLLENDGTGHFTDVTATLPSFGVGGSVTSVLLVDLDADGEAELFVNGYGTNLLFDRTPAGWTDRSAGLPPALPAMRWVARDLDLDGDVDLAGAAFFLAGGFDTVLRNQGNLVFTATAPFAGQSLDLRLGDVDGDLDLDVLLGSPTKLLRNDGAMVFTDVTTTALAGVGPAEYADFADVDGDGDLDLVIGGINTAFGQLWRNGGTGVFALVPGAIPPLQNSHRALRLFDVDADGDPDLVRTEQNGVVRLARNDGTGLFLDAPGAMPPLGGTSASIAVGDLDGDADDDVVLMTSTGVGYLLRNLHREIVVPQPPAIGQPWTVQVFHAPGYATAPRPGLLGIGLARLPQPLPLPPLGNLWLDLGAPLLLDPLVVPTSGPALSTFVIPNGPGLVGVALHVQSLIEEGPGGLASARLTTAATAVIQ